MSQHAAEVAVNPADARAPKVVEGRRTIKPMNLVRAEEVDLVLRMPSQSDRTVTYNINFRVPDEVRRRDAAMIPLREHVKHCSCPDFTRRYLNEGMNTPLQTSYAVAQPWCKHIATAMWCISSDYRVVFSEEIMEHALREYRLGASSAAPAAGAGTLSIQDASDAASAAVAGVQDRVDTQSTANEETELVLSLIHI